MSLRAPSVPPELAWLRAFRDPEDVLNWSLADWEHSIRLGYRLRLLGRLAEAVDGAGLMPNVPAPARAHLIAEQSVSRWRIAAVTWTAGRVGAAFSSAAYPRVLLKGAAYIGQSLPIAAGRVPADLDILVPRVWIDDAQARLLAAGWVESPMDDHDRQYYREWSHELPPMTHPDLGVELDLHHNIVPPVGHVPLEADRLLERLIPSSWPAWHVLAPEDQVLHSASHLFFDSELRGRMRDLVDLDGLLRHFGSLNDQFWPRLLTRSTALGLQEPLALALHFTSRWLGTPIPRSIAREAAQAGPGRLRRAWLLRALANLLRPTDPDKVPGHVQSATATLILGRYHFRRMPMRLLVPHLWHKWRKHEQVQQPAVLAPRRR